jgi:geranylgeranyl diphosphate synthase type II
VNATGQSGVEGRASESSFPGERESLDSGERQSSDPGERERGRAGSPDPGALDSSYPEHLRELVERYLQAMRFSEEALTAGLEEAMRYSLLAGGKRIRPVLALATARAVGLEQQQALPLAGAIELIHTYSLIHDDLPAMDDDALRRGQPTCHVKFGEDVAILAGDGLYAEAFRHLLGERRGAPERVLAAAAELAAATGVGGMVGGQYADVSPRTPSGPGALRRLHELKTGRLIGASVMCVLFLAGIEDGPATIEFRRFAAELGVLFQIVDDILDVTGTDDALGKPQGSDERHGKRTYVSEFGIERARELAGESHRTARQALAAAAAQMRQTNSTGELEQITDFIYTRTS